MKVLCKFSMNERIDGWMDGWVPSHSRSQSPYSRSLPQGCLTDCLSCHYPCSPSSFPPPECSVHAPAPRSLPLWLCLPGNSSPRYPSVLRLYLGEQLSPTTTIVLCTLSLPHSACFFLTCSMCHHLLYIPLCVPPPVELKQT